jgi:type I restriction-modification system DNA methylase subunit
MDRGQVQAQVAALVQRYDGSSATRRASFNEEATKQEFILRVFDALGWNTHDTDEVAPEVSAGRGRADYVFRVNGVTRFTLEAKSLDHAFTDNDARQAIQYAYNRGVRWAVLTNFRQLYVFYADAVQGANPWAAMGGLPRFEAPQDYLDRLDDLLLLARGSFLEGRFEQEAERLAPLARRRPPVEKALFDQLRDWRGKLYTHLYQGSKGKLSLGQIDEVIQRLFNRLVFIRTAEDRLLEDPVLRPILRDNTRRSRVTAELQQVFDQFDKNYDSELFQRALLDGLLVNRALDIAQDTLLQIMDGLYRVPGGFIEYDFSLIGADVLGRVYEQYLGYVAQVARERAEAAQKRTLPGFEQEIIELAEKRAKRKASGIFYTPRWVVDYIVRKTLSPALAARRDRSRPIRVLDPSCGSGSFLIRALDALIEDEARFTGNDLRAIDTHQRAALARDSLFGVDLDQQAVEIARLNLMLRSLAGRDRLPMLRDNVRRGNALISPETDVLPSWDALDWDASFPWLAAEGGFDVIIGNPPYVRIQSIDRAQADWFRGHYESAHGSYDLYVLFLERALKLLKPGGRAGFITSGKFLKAAYGAKLQQFLNREVTVEEIIDLSAIPNVFGDATTYPVIIIFQKNPTAHPEPVEGHVPSPSAPSPSPLMGEGRGEGESSAHSNTPTAQPARPLRYIRIPADTDIPERDFDPASLAGRSISVPQSALQEGVWPPQPKSGNNLWQKLHQGHVVLDQSAQRIFQGFPTGADKVFILDRLSDSSEIDSLVHVRSRQTGKEYRVERELLHPVLVGSEHVHRWRIDAEPLVLLFPYDDNGSSVSLIPSSKFAVDYPKIWQYLEDHKALLEGRERGRWKGENWHKYSRPQNLEEFIRPRARLLATSIAVQASFALDPDGAYFFTGGGSSGVYGITLRPEVLFTPAYLLALLNSRALEYVLRQLSSVFRGGYFVQRPQYLRKLPIAVPDTASGSSRQQHDALAKLAQDATDIHARIAAKGNLHDTERTDLEQEARRLDQQIDALVYDLYGLTQAERALIEQEVPRP